VLAAFVTPMRHALSELALPHSISSPARASTVPEDRETEGLGGPEIDNKLNVNLSTNAATTSRHRVREIQFHAARKSAGLH
jgi:hypothetical protein